MINYYFCLTIHNTLIMLLILCREFYYILIIYFLRSQPHRSLKSPEREGEENKRIGLWFFFFIFFNIFVKEPHLKLCPSRQKPSIFLWCFKGITESRQFISTPQAIRGCDYSHWGLYIEMFCPLSLCEWERSCPVKSPHSRTARLLTPYALTQHHGFLFSRTLHDFCPGSVHPEVRCVRTCYQMRTMWCYCAAFVQTFSQGLRREGPRTGLRLLHDLCAELRPTVRRVHREMWLRADLSTCARWNETSAGSAGGTGDLCKRN